MMSLCVALYGISRASSPNFIGSARPLMMTYCTSNKQPHLT
jgi:hypothetical protein